MSKKILIVDDDAGMRDALAGLLGFENFTVITAEDGLLGLQKAEAEDPDLIITDIYMPRLNGIEMIKLLRQELKFNRMPILTVTAYGSKLGDEAIEAGANQSLSKPLDFYSLINSINQLLH